MKSVFKKSLLIAAASVFTSGLAFANLEQVKIYKSVFPDEKPKCTNCHVDKMPKKDDGKHDWNEYGLKIRKVKEKPDADTYKQVGKNENADNG